jgi:hypothetical protein
VKTKDTVVSKCNLALKALRYSVRAFIFLWLYYYRGRVGNLIKSWSQERFDAHMRFTLRKLIDQEWLDMIVNKWRI